MARAWDRSPFGSVTLRGLLATMFLLAGGMKLMTVPFEVAGFIRFGYPLWFMYLVGILQLVGAALLWTRGFIGFGASLLAVLMVGAVGAHLRAGDPVLMAVPAFVLLLLLAGLAYARRQELLALAPGVAAART